MPNLADLDRLRYAILEAAYDAHSQEPRGWLPYDKLAEAHERAVKDVELAVDWLKARNLATKPAWAPLLEITPQGMDEVEDRRRTLEPSDGASVGVAPETQRLVEVVVAEIGTFLREHGDELDRDDTADLQAQADTLAAQGRSPKPRRSVIAAATAAAKWTASRAAAGAVEGGAFAALYQLATAVAG